MMATAVTMRLRYRSQGTHVHCRLFTANRDVQASVGPDGEPFVGFQWALSGALVFRIDEWASVRAQLEGSVYIVEEE